MSRARILLLVVALVAGGLAAFLATRGSAPPPAPTVTEVRQEPKTQILVASQPIGVGERLSAANLEWQDWPEGAVRPEYVTVSLVPDATEKLTGAVARFEIFPGEPIREAKLATADRGYLSAVITPGMRAVSLDITATSGAGGFIVPNDRVDVILTRSESGSERSETILRNVKVLAIGARLGEVGESGGADEDDPEAKTFQKATIATLELTPGQAEALVTSEQSGRLSLALRSVADFGEKIDPGSYGSGSTIRMIRYGKEVSLMAGSDPNAAAQPVAAAAPEQPAAAPAIATPPQFPATAPESAPSAPVTPQ